jgi:hypothetical protein
MIFIYFWTSLSSSCFFLVAPMSIKLKRFCRTSIGGAHVHENLKRKNKKQRRHGKCLAIIVMFADGCVYPNGTF